MGRHSLIKIVCALLPLTLLIGCDGSRRAPTYGSVVSVDHDSAACTGTTDDAGTPLSSAVTYRPAGTDTNGDVWPNTFVCLLPANASKYLTRSNYP